MRRHWPCRNVEAEFEPITNSSLFDSHFCFSARQHEPLPSLRDVGHRFSAVTVLPLPLCTPNRGHGSQPQYPRHYGRTRMAQNNDAAEEPVKTGWRSGWGRRGGKHEGRPRQGEAHMVRPDSMFCCSHWRVNAHRNLTWRCHYYVIDDSHHPIPTQWTQHERVTLNAGVLNQTRTSRMQMCLVNASNPPQCIEPNPTPRIQPSFSTPLCQPTQVDKYKLNELTHQPSTRIPRRPIDDTSNPPWCDEPRRTSTRGHENRIRFRGGLQHGEWKNADTRQVRGRPRARGGARGREWEAKWRERGWGGGGAPRMCRGESEWEWTRKSNDDTTSLMSLSSIQQKTRCEVWTNGGVWRM